MTSTNDGKDVKSYQTSVPKGKTYYIELYKSLEARLSEGGDASERTKYLCEAWRRVHSLCQHSAPSTHTHLINWLQRHTARAVLQTEWQTPKRKDDRASLEEAINAFIEESEATKATRDGDSAPWELQLVARGEWFKRVLEHPWDHPVLTLLLNPNGCPPTDDEVLEWLKEERGVTFVMRLHTLVGEKCDDIAAVLATAVMDRVRAALPPVSDADEPIDEPPPEKAEPTFGDKLKEEAGFTTDVWDMLTDIEFVLLHKRDSKRCIALAKQTPLLSAYHLIERLQKRLEISPREKRMWKNAKEVAVLIAQVAIARCMVVRECGGARRTALYCCARLLARLLGARLPAAADALAHQAPSAAHLHTLAHAVDKQLSPTNESMKPYVCELYVRAITAGMNELEKLKLKTEKEEEARSMEKTLASWFVQLGDVLSQSNRIKCECTLTAFSLHPSQKMYERLDAAPQPAPVVVDSDEIKEDTVRSEFGSWANDSRSQTNFVKTSETLNMKHTQNQANVLSTAIFNEGETLGLSLELCQDIAVLLSGPRVKTFSWDMDRALLLKNCRAYSEQTHGGTRVLTRELKYLNIDPTQYQHLPEDRDDDENDPYYGIERGYEHHTSAITEGSEEMWEDTNSAERTETASSSIEDDFIAPRRKKKNKHIPLSSDEDSDPLSFMAEAKRVQKKKERPHSKERSKERAKKKQELVDPLHIDVQNIQNQNLKKDKPKEKKERKKKENAPRVNVENRNSLGNLVGVKVATKKKPVKNITTIMTPATDSDYDSQGKCSAASINSEGNEHDECSFSMDDLKSLERQDFHNTDDMKLMKNNEFRTGNAVVKISPSQSLQRPPNNLTKLPYRPQTPSTVRRQSPSDHNRNLSPNYKNYPDDVRASITKLLEFRRQRASIELNMKQQNTQQTPPRTPAIIRPDIPIQTNISPKAVAIPDIPKSYIKKQHAEKLAKLKREVDTIIAQRREKKLNSDDSVIQYAKKSGFNKAMTSSANAIESRSRVQQSNTNSLKMTDLVNVPYDRLMAEIAERQDRNNHEVIRSPHTRHQPGQPSLQRSENVVTPGQRDYQNFLKEYEQSKYITSSHALDMSAKRLSKDGKKEIMPISRVVPLVPNVITKPELKTHSAKQSTHLKKSDNSLNTFSRLSYMHKNKQTEKKNKNLTEKPVYSNSTYQEVSSELDQIIKEHQRAQMKAKQDKNDRFDRLLMKPLNANSQELIKNDTSGAKEHPLLTNLLQNTSSSNSITSLYRNESHLKNCHVQQKHVVSPPKTSLSEKDQNDLLNLLRQQNKLNVSNHISTNMDSKPSTSRTSNNAVTNNFSPIPNNNSTSGQKQQYSKPTSQGKNSFQSSLETKIINIISNTLIKQQSHVNTEDYGSDKSTSAIFSGIKSVKETEPQDKVRKNAATKSHVKKNPVKRISESEKPEWQAVMSDLLKHKTPIRGPNALDVALNKSSFELAFEKSLREPSIFAPKQSSENNLEPVKRHGKAPKPATTSAHNIIITNKGLKSKAEIPKQQKASSDLKKYSDLKNPVISMNHKIIKQNRPDIAKKLPQDVQRKQFTYAGPKHDDPFISGIPNSDYDLLEELMDDDLRKEIGELSSDDESYNVAAQSFLKTTKSNEKRVSVEFNKPLNDMTIKKPSTDVRCLNARQPSCETMQSAIEKPVIQCVNKMVHGSNTIKVSQNSANDKIQDNICLVTTTSQSAPVNFPIAPNSQNQAYSNVKMLSNNQEMIDPKMYISTITQQAPLQNVVLIGSELVYDRYSAIQTPVHCVSNIAPSAYVTINNASSMTLYQTTKFSAPVVNPLIIESSITAPIIHNATCVTIPVQPSMINNLAQPTYLATSVVPKTPVLDPHMGRKICDSNDEIRNSPLLQNDQLLEGNKANERKVLSEVQEIAVNEKIEKTRSQEIDYDMIMKKEVSANAERLKKKRLAIINREINHRCEDNPIPLTYSPLPVKTQPVSKQHIISEAIPLTYTSLSPNEDNQKSPDCEDEKLITQLKHNLQDLSDSINEVQSPATPDSNESKENKNLQTVPYRRIMLRSSNKITKADSTVSENSSNEKSKVKLKLDNPEATVKVRDKSSQNNTNDKEASTPKRASKRLRNKTLTTISKEEKLKNQHLKPSPETKLSLKSKINSKLEDETGKSGLSSISDDMAYYDIEAELLGSKISKSVSKNKEKDSNKSKDVLQYTTDKKTNDVNSVNKKLCDKIINKTNEQATDLSKDEIDQNTEVVKPTCDDFNVEKQNHAVKKVHNIPSEISISQKTKCVHMCSCVCGTDNVAIKDSVKPACQNFNVDMANADAKEAKSIVSEVSISLEKKSALEHTTDIKMDDIAANLIRNPITDNSDELIRAKNVSKDEKYKNTNAIAEKVFDKPACYDLNKMSTSDNNEIKITSDSKDSNNQTSLEVLATNVTMVDTRNTTCVDDQNTDDLVENENIDLDMTVTCEEVNVSKMIPTFANVKTKRNTDTNAENIDDVTISVDIKENKSRINQTQTPISSVTSEKTELYTENIDLALVSVPRKITHNNHQIESRHEAPRALSEVSTITNTTAIIGGEIVILDDDSKLKEPNEMHSEVPTMANTTPNTNDEIIILDDDSKTISEVFGKIHSNDVTQKMANMQATPSLTDLDDVSEIPQSFKDSIHIEHLPSDDPLKRSVRVSLPNGRKFKATVYGAVHVTFDTLFAYPSIKSTLLNGLNYKKLYTMNLKQITTVAKSDPTKIISAQILDIQSKMPTEPVETIDLLSDEEVECLTRVIDTDTQTFDTEYGKFKISPISKDMFTKHQKKLSLKSLISLKKVDSKPDRIKIQISNKEKTNKSNTLPLIPDQYVTGLINDIQNQVTSQIIHTPGNEVVEIDDSSNDSLKQGTSVRNAPDKTIMELKNVLLKELGVVEAQTTTNILQKKRIQSRNTEVIEKINSTEACPRPSATLQLSAIPTSESCLFIDLDKEEQLKITKRKCFIQLNRCDDLVKMYKANNRDRLETPAKVLSKEALPAAIPIKQVPEDYSFAITEDFSILDDLDTNIIDSDARTSSPVIELSDVLVSLDNKCLIHSEPAVFQGISLSCEANWFTTKAMMHLHSVIDNVFMQPNSLDQNVKEICSKSSTSSVINEMPAKVVRTQTTCAPSLMSLVLKYFQNTNIVHQYKLLQEAITRSPVSSLKRKSSSLESRTAFKVPKLNDDITIQQKRIDCITSYNVSLDSSLSDTTVSILEEINSDTEINPIDKSIDTMTNLLLYVTDNDDTHEISPTVCSTNLNDNSNLDVHNDVEVQDLDKNCESYNDVKVDGIDSSYYNHDYDKELVNTISEKNIEGLGNTNNDRAISPEKMNSLKERPITDIDSVHEPRSPSPVIEIAHLLTCNDTIANTDNNINVLSSHVETIPDEQRDKVHTNSEICSIISQAKQIAYTDSGNTTILETVLDEQEVLFVDSVKEICLTIQGKETTHTLLESDVTSFCSSQFQSKEDNEKNVSNDCDDIEIRLAKLVGKSLVDVESEKQIQRNCNECDMNENNTPEIVSKENETGSNIQIILNDKSLEESNLRTMDLSESNENQSVYFQGNRITEIQNSPETCSKIEDRKNESSEAKHKVFYVSTEDIIVLPEDEPVKEITAETIYMHSDEIVDDILFESTRTNIDSAEKEAHDLVSQAGIKDKESESLDDVVLNEDVCGLATHEENESKTIGDDCFSQVKEQQSKIENLKVMVLDEKEARDLSNHDENVPLNIYDDCFSQIEEQQSKTENLKGIVLDETETCDLATQNVSTHIDDSTSVEAQDTNTQNYENVLDLKEVFTTYLSNEVDCSQVEKLDSKKIKDTIVEKEKENEVSADSSDEKYLSIEDNSDNIENATFTSADVSTETIVSKYLTLIENNSEVLEGVVEYEDPEAGTCYVIPIIEKFSETDILSNENTDPNSTEKVVTAIIKGLCVNEGKVNDEVINIDSAREINQPSLSIESNKKQVLDYDIERKIAKIVGESLTDFDTEEQNQENCFYKSLESQNLETSAAKTNLDEKYKTTYSVEVEVISEPETDSEDVIRQLLETNDQNHANQKRSHAESSIESNEKGRVSKVSKMELLENFVQSQHIHKEPYNENLEVIVPKHTYAKGTECISQRWQNLKRKMDMSDTKTNKKKYRKGKNIDYPKITAAAMSESAYAKEYKRLIDYCSSVKFSYALSFHKDNIDVHNTLKSWPIKSSYAVTAEDSKETNGTLFVETEKSEALLDPLKQTLSDEISSEYDENSYTPSNIDETNFNMGFGEGSGRVIQKSKDGEYTTFSAATLSDVKQLQPLLPSDVQKAFVQPNDINNEHQDQLLKTMRFVDRLNLREKVRSFFKKNEAELTLECVLNSKKEDCEHINGDSDWPFGDLTSSRYFQLPFPIETTVNVVQVGQLPVSAAAQNPVTCDPRVTHVSNVSPQSSPENSSGDELQTTIKTEYTELTTANITLPLMQEYAQHHDSMPTEPQTPTNVYGANNTISMSTEIKSVVKIELMEETSQENLDENIDSEYDNLQRLSNGNVNNGGQYQFNNIANNITIASDPTAPAVANPIKKTKIVASFPKEKQQNNTSEKSNQIAHMMNAAGISATQTMAKQNGTALGNQVSEKSQSDVVTTSQANTSNYSKSVPVSAVALQQALAQILPPPSLHQTNTSDNNQQTSTNPQVLHIVQGNNAQSVINKPNGTQLLHIVQNKSAAATNGTPTSQQNNFSGLSLVDGAIQQNGNQVLHIMNTGNHKNSNAGQLLKRVNLLTNLANVQGSNEQKMVQFVCKSADGQSIQLPHQRSMVLRLQPFDPSNAPTVPKQNESQDLTSSSSTTHSVNDKEPSPQEMKSRSLYEENYAKFVQNGDSKPSQEKSTSLPKFNQVFGKQVYQDNQNEMDIEHLPEDSESISENNNIQLEEIQDIGSPPMLTRKPQTQPQTQPNLVQQIKQNVGPTNSQTMHGGVIYTRQIPVNLGNGQTINLITVPSTERVDDSFQNQKPDGKFGNQEGDSPVIKIVPTNQHTTTPTASTEDNNAQMRSTNETNNQHNPQPQPQPVLTQMRIKLPMLSKAPQMVGGTRVVRPAFFQIQRNVIGGANQHVYQQLVLTAAPPLGQSIRIPVQAQKSKTPSETQSSPESQMSSSTLEQLREFDMVLEQVKERSTVQPGTSSSSNNKLTKLKTSPDTTDASPSTSTQASSTPVLYSVGNTRPLNMVNYANRKSTITSTTTSSYVRSPDSTGVVESPSSSTHANLPHTATAESCATSSSVSEAAAATPVQPKPKKKKKPSNPNPFNIKNTPKPSSTQKPLEDEQTTQRILYILAEYREQVENSPDKDKPAPRRRNNPAAPNPGSSKRKKSSSGSQRRDMSPVVGEDGCRTMESEDSSCGTSLGECNECLEAHSPEEESPRKVVRRLTFEQETHITQTRTIPQRNVIVTDGQAFAVRGATGKPTTTVLMPANYLLPVSMVKGGQQIAIMTNRGPKLLVGTGEGGTGGTLLFQRLIGPGGLKPVLARPGVRHIRLPTAALHNIQTFNIATPATTVQPPDSTASPAPAPTPPDLVDNTAMSSPWRDREPGEVKPDKANTSPEESEPWNLPSSSIVDDYGYEEIVRTDNMDRTVLDAIPDRYSPDMEAQRIFDKMFDNDSKKSMYDSRCGYDIDASDDDKAYHQVVQRKDGRQTTRLTHVSAAALRHKYAILEHELRLQKSLSEECEDLGVDSPSASELFPEAELLFAPSPAQEQTIEHCSTPQPTVLTQGIPEPDLDDQIATAHVFTHKTRHEELDINLDDVGEIVTVGEDGMTTIPLDHEEFARSHEEFARSHPNTTFHSEPEDGEIPPYTITQGIKGRQVTFHTRGVPGTVVVAPQTTVISQATVEATGTQETVKFTDIDNMINAMPSPQHPHLHNINMPTVLVRDSNEGITKFDRLLNESREVHLSNTASAIVHSTGNGTQVIRRVHYETRRDTRYFIEDRDALVTSEAKTVPDDRRNVQSKGENDTAPSERHSELFWESNAPVRPERRRFEFSSDSDKCCKSPNDDVNSDSSGIGPHTRLDSVIKAARSERSRSDGSSTDDSHPPLRTYPAKRPHQHIHHSHHSELDRNVTGKARVTDRCHDVKDESRRRASNRGVVKRGCHCCNGSTAPPKPKKSRPKKSSEFH